MIMNDYYTVDYKQQLASIAEWNLKSTGTSPLQGQGLSMKGGIKCQHVRTADQ